MNRTLLYFIATALVMLVYGGVGAFILGISVRQGYLAAIGIVVSVAASILFRVTLDHF